MQYKPLDHTAVFPTAFGNETENGMMDNVSGAFDEPYILAELIAGGMMLPKGLVIIGRFMSNGFKLYPGGSHQTPEPTNIEVATPECATPTQLATYARAGSVLLSRTIENFAIESSNAIGSYAARVQHRVVDSAGSRKGCHDNYGIDEQTPFGSMLKNTPAMSIPRGITEHLVSIPIATGAGLIGNDELFYSQKMGGLEETYGYGFKGTMYRLDTADGTLRLETRCNDVNISDWAIRMRVGSTALVLALCHTPLHDELLGETYFPTNENEIIARAKQTNRLNLTRDGTITGNPLTTAAVNFEQKVAELVMDKLPSYIDELPDEYFRIAHDLYEYCDDFRKVTEGKATIATLADRADWAAKFQLVQNDIERDEEFGIKRTMYDYEARAMDMKYDIERITANDGEVHATQWGKGYKMRKRGMFAWQAPDIEVARAFHEPPTETRAAVRGRLIRDYAASIVGCDWKRISFANQEHRVVIDDVRQNQLPASLSWEELDYYYGITA